MACQRAKNSVCEIIKRVSWPTFISSIDCIPLNALLLMKSLVPTFEENGIFMLDVVFFIQAIFADRIIVFDKTFLFLIEDDIDSLSSNLKRYFISN